VDIAEQVATTIAGRLASAQRTSVAARLTDVPRAYEYFFRGNALIAARSARATDRAIHEYEIATRFDPGFTSALARIAYCYGILLTWGWDPRGLSRDSLLNLGLAAADRALRRDSMSSDVWMARGYLLSARNPRTFEGVREVFQRALALNPRNAEAHHQYGSALRLMGRDAESAAMLERALAIEPGRPVTHFVRAELDMVAGRLPAARAWLDSAVLSDARMYFALAQRARIRAMVGDSAGARSDAETAIVVSQAEDSLWGNAAMALVEAQAGDTASARARLDRLVRAFAVRGTEPHAAWMIASGYLALHDSGRALDILESATPRGGRIWFYMRMPEFDPIRGQSRFVQLVADSRPSGAP
jgi:tetratricopeptide (TPR) repeat protein